MLKFARTACHFMSAQGFSVNHKDSISKWKLSTPTPLENFVVLRRVIMTEMQHAKISRMRLNTLCLWIVVLSPRNHRSSSRQ